MDQFLVVNANERLPPMAYFKRRLNQAPRDVSYTLQFVKDTARPREMQEACVAAVRFKCDVLWAQLDALYLAYVVGMVPPGASRMTPG